MRILTAREFNHRFTPLIPLAKFSKPSGIALKKNHTMRLSLFILILFLITACQKTGVTPPPTPPVDTHPQMRYTNLVDTSILFGRAASFDLDGDGNKDIYFATQLVGDPIYQVDKKQWLAGGGITTHFPVNTNESIPVMKAMDAIPIESFSGYNWYNAPEILVAQKIISYTTAPYWTGDWKNADHHFMPVQIKNGNDLFNGWVEVSFSTDLEKMILHKAALSKEANKAIKAGK